MSRQLITEYRSELDRIHAASGSKRESVVREAFKDLLKRWGKSRDLIFLAEHEYIPPAGNRCYIDGALVHSIRVPFGYWEAKDTNDVLDEEIRKKTAKGYPRDNIIYEDTATAVLIQNKREVARAPMDDADALFHLLESFFRYERPEIADFRKAVKQFAADLPAVLERLREIIAEKRASSRDFASAERKFLDHARDLHFGAAVDAYQQVPRYRYAESGDRIDNITEWALNKFTANYGKKAGVTKDAIFSYCYAILHDPLYREKYALNLKREFPRIPFYDDFAQWADWGQQLLDLHIGYEQAKPFKLNRIDTPNPKRARGSHPKPKLKSEPDKGLVIVDEDTQLTGIPREAWDYRLGNRSAIDWVLDQHKEKKPRDPMIREKFNTYRFADYKESMIDLLAKVVTVSLETVKITEAMRALERSQKDQGE